ncbi:MAG: STAS/SEC14 domain-containing protein [Polyangiaceae bacterium]
MDSPHPWVSLEAFPIVIIRFRDDVAIAELRSMTHSLRRFVASLDEPFAVMSDLTGVRSSDPEGRAVYVEFVKDMKRSTGHRVRATAVITSNAFQRTILNLHMALIGNTPYPVRAFSSREHALPWLRARLDASPMAHPGST